MTANNNYAILDSWGAGFNNETGKDYDGWAQMLGWPADNILAVSGSTAGEWAWGRHRPRLNSIPDNATVFCFGGGNDVRHAHSDGVVTHEEEMVIYNALLDICNALTAKRCKVIVFGYADPFRGTIPAMADGLWELNSALEIGAKMFGCEYHDLNAVMEDHHFLPPEIVQAQNAIHPNTQGYRFIADYVAGILVEISKEQAEGDAK